jgi:hypothetical protein
MRNKNYEEKISKLESQVEQLQRDVQLSQMREETYWNPYLGECHHIDSYPLNKVVEMILDHLGLELRPKRLELAGKEKK